jgi:ABC-type branched-subunit amino acid transport system substrate-binding protein
MKALLLAAVAAVVVLALAACGSSSTRQAPASGTTAPTISLWVSGTASDYRQLAAGVKLALSEAEGRAGKFRINYAGRQVSDDPAQAEADALNNARTSLKDTQASAVITNAPAAAARPAITLLNEAGISAVSVGDDALKTEACSAGSDIFPAGHQTAIVITDSTPPASFTSSFTSALGFKPTTTAWRAYEGTKSVLSSLAAPGVATNDKTPRLNRDALASALVSAHSNCT